MPPHTTPIQTVRDQIAGHLRTDILAGTLPKGVALREQPLAERFGVSRGPIRDVLLRLTQEGLLVSEPNCGVRVSPAPSEWMQPLIVSQRREIEVFALRKSILEIDDETIAELTEMVESLGRACERGDLGALAERDIAFHRRLLVCAGEEDLIAIWLPLVTRMIMHYSRHDNMAQSYEEHLAILDAVRDRDVERAIARLAANIQ